MEVPILPPAAQSTPAALDWQRIGCMHSRRLVHRAAFDV